MNPNAHVERRRTAALSTAVAIAALMTPVAAAQQDAAAKARPSFEAATIKLAAPDAVRNRVMPTSPNRLSIPSMSLVWLI
jgi:hypothetical protein